MVASGSVPMDEVRYPRAASVEALLRLDGRSIAVTGGASGIGLAVVEAVLSLGARATIIDYLPDAVEGAVRRLADEGFDVDGKIADVTDSVAVDEALRHAASHTGQLNGLVASAGTRMKFRPMTELTDEEWQRVVDVNLNGLFYTHRAGAKIMAQQGSGSIVTIASLSGHVPRYHQSVYGVSKAAALHLSRVLALELAADGVRVNTVSPGTTLTPIFESALQTEGADIVSQRIGGDLARHRGGIPVRRFADPIDPAAAAVFLLSDAARHITGESILVDGGEALV
jgi:2,3-dihydro-2,3-dihydroxybenzoate dehydrogenase